MSKNLTDIYQDYEVQPCISSERNLETWLRNPKPVPKSNMVKLADGLLAGDIILLWRIQFGTFTTVSAFPKYFEYTYGIDASARLQMLLDQDYARVQTAFESLPHLNTTEKKAVLKTKSVSGLSKMKVADLDRALAEHFTEEELSNHFSIRGYSLTEKGAQALLDNQAVVDRHPQETFLKEFTMAKRLTRDADNKVIAGVCSGLARYFDIDPVIVRVLWGVAFFAYGIGLIPYLVFWIVVPAE